MIAAEDLLARFENVRPRGPGDWMVECPCHDDRTPSLHITQTVDCYLFHDHGGCRTEDVLAEAKLDWADIFADRQNGGAEIAATYDYRDERGRLLFQAVRFSPKDFRQRRRVGGEWVWNLSGVRRVLYRLPGLRRAASTGATVYVAEGEKDVEALERAGAVATTNPMGAGKWSDEYSEALADAEVVVIADRDEGGTRARQRGGRLPGGEGAVGPGGRARRG
jgi:putative DNA primase/helicase